MLTAALLGVGVVVALAVTTFAAVIGIAICSAGAVTIAIVLLVNPYDD